MRVAIVTDAWEPQVNGVVRTLQVTRRELEARGHDVAILGPDRFRSLPCPTYPEIRLALGGPAAIGRIIAGFGAEAVHIATEGPLGLAARRWCLRQGRSFTTAYHTHFPDYVAARTRLPAAWVWHYIRWFHGPAAAVLVSTPTLRRMLAAHGLAHTRLWGRGADLGLFRPHRSAVDPFADLPRPIQLYVGRVAIEKNLPAFLETRHPGTRVVVGDGPARAMLAARYPDARFLGALSGEALAAAYAGADVFVFPSRTDTFGLVMIEALACGTPVAAYPVPGPADIITPGTGALDENLETAIARALACDRALCAARGAGFGWAESARQFLDALVPDGEVRRAA
ncbi:alpha-mannosyltransferase [Sphingomonas oleivorans]|uniref:Alpha-mannosyltransferase n=1 Tax=Sphingomonas oleivorans TaxID=1735121 RepID=A0A2T5G018_9SPHN|nr:glycosyltransferase family 1 protein [Sphingomonas oleivorans]PTQ12302.1 alpha-mannosyltransferase [Sphingomonas oleivorans]